MTNSFSKDFRNTHFKYKELDKIHGTPYIFTLLRIFRQLKRNAQSVPTTLGWGQLGYLALDLSTAAYASIPNSRVFVRPVHPGAFTIQALPITRAAVPLTEADIAHQKARHDEAICTYTEYQSVEQTLRSQLVEAVHSDF